MAKTFYSVKASVTVDVELQIAAISKEEAEKIFNDKLAMSASLPDLKEVDDWFPAEDSITDIEVTDVLGEEDA